MLSVYLILVKLAVKSVLAIDTKLDQTKTGLGPKKLRIDQKKLEQLQLCQVTLEQIIDPSDEEFQKNFYKVCFRKSWKNHMLYLNKVRIKPSWTQPEPFIEPNLIVISAKGSTEKCKRSFGVKCITNLQASLQKNSISGENDCTVQVSWSFT